MRELDDPRRRYHRDEKAEHEKENADNHGRGDILPGWLEVLIAKRINNTIAGSVRKWEREVLFTSHQPSPSGQSLGTMGASVERHSDFSTVPARGNPWRFEEVEGGNWRRIPESAPEIMLVRQQ